MSEIEKSKKEGVYTFVNTEEKFAAASWKAYLSKFGKVIEGKSGSFSSTDIVIPGVSDNPVKLVSKVSEENKKVKLFISIATGADEFIQTGHAKLSEAERQAVSITPGLIRISVGLEHKDDILADILQALGAS
jgi:hypothetical protein